MSELQVTDSKTDSVTNNRLRATQTKDEQKWIAVAVSWLVADGFGVQHDSNLVLLLWLGNEFDVVSC